MSFLDFFRSKPETTPRRASRTKPGEVRKWAADLNKNAREHERQASIDALARIGTKAAAAALLKRFTFETEPSITDREEKESAFRAIVAIGDDAIQPVRDYCARGQSVTWGVRILREVLDGETYVEELLELLAAWDTDYVRNPDPKIQLLAALDDVVDDRVVPAVARFLEDVHEPTRFQAAGAILSQGDPQAAGPLARAAAREEARRTINRIADGLANRGWAVPEEHHVHFARTLPFPYRLDGRGVVVRAMR
jgi:HEAT repeat protein